MTKKDKLNIPINNKITEYSLNNKKNYSYLIEFEEKSKIEVLLKKIKLNKLEIEKLIIDFKIDNKIFIKFDYFENILIKLNYRILKEFVSLNKVFIVLKKINKKIFKIRPPIITVIGHVDHGKTSILDVLNNTNMIDKEIGGITQYIKIHKTNLNKNLFIFIDTPGHESFLEIRDYCTKITDVIMLVISVDDVYNKKVIELINKTKLFNNLIIIVINKIDKIDFNLDIIESEFCKYNIISKRLGGEYEFIYVSTKSNIGIDNLIKNIVYKSKLLNLSYLYNGITSGFIIETYIDKNKGLCVFILIKEGILKIGDFIISEFSFGNVKCMFDEFDNKIKIADPSIPVKIFGLSEIPKVGNKFFVVNNKKEAKEILINRKNFNKELNLLKIDNLKKIDFDKNKCFNLKNDLILNLILKSDVQGTCNAIIFSINKLSIENNFNINIIKKGVGTITENDLYIALSSKSILLGFNIKINNNIYKLINKFKLEFKSFLVIYDLIDYLKNLIDKYTLIKEKNSIIGSAEVINIFNINKLNIIGCKMKFGIISKINQIKIIRSDTTIYIGKISSMKSFKKDVIEVNNNMEFGISVLNKNKIKIGDILLSAIEF